MSTTRQLGTSMFLVFIIFEKHFRKKPLGKSFCKSINVVV
jgi:hypothetical protein